VAVEAHDDRGAEEVGLGDPTRLIHDHPELRALTLEKGDRIGDLAANSDLATRPLHVCDPDRARSAWEDAYVGSGAFGMPATARKRSTSLPVQPKYPSLGSSYPLLQASASDAASAALSRQ